MSDSTTEISEQRWSELLEDWKRSGLNQSAWCRENQIGLHRFRYWKKKLEGRAAAGSMVRVPVKVAQVAEVLELRCGRYSVRVPAGFDAQTLSRLLRVLDTQR